MIAGCVSNGAGPRPWSPLATFAPQGTGPRIVVYGSLTSLLPNYQAATTLDRFLYGPSDFGKTILRNPQGMTLWGEQLLVCDQGYPAILGFHLPSGQSLFWNDSDEAPRCPIAITHDTAGRVYVADTTRRSVMIYGPDRRLIEELAPPDAGPNGFRPCAVAAQDETLYIGDLNGRVVRRWSIETRQWLESLSPPGRLKLVAPTGLALTPEGTLLIVDAIRAHALRMTPAGQWLEPLGGPGRAAGQLIRPKQVCCTSSGHIFVTDAGRQSVVVFDASGRFITELHEQTDSWPGWTLPAGVMAMEATTLEPIFAAAGTGPEPRPDEWVVVSDSLGVPPLTLLGVFRASSTGQGGSQ